MFSVFAMPKVDKPSVPHVLCEDAPRLVEGVSEINTLCPVNKLTGKRSSVLSLLYMVGDGKVNERVINTLLQDLPVIQNDSNLNDADRFNFLAHRLESGTPAEDALMSERLFLVAKDLGINTDNLSRGSDGKVIFDGSPAEKENVESEIK